MFLKWLPWKFFIQRAAQAYGVIDPITWMAKMRRFAQPSEVAEPLDLLRAGIIFHARGMINTRAIQNNLDWIWPYWVQRQFNPQDNSFIPRAFSLSHINLTHRNWTAVGLPDLSVFPLVDPRGLVTPLYDGWSLDAWLLADDGGKLFPAEQKRAKQFIDIAKGWAVVTLLEQDELAIASRVTVHRDVNLPYLTIRLEAHSHRSGHLVVALRPYNPEGVQFIHTLSRRDRQHLTVNNETDVFLDPAPDRILFSTYHQGDVLHEMEHAAEPGVDTVHCPVGMATGAALFPLQSDFSQTVQIRINLEDEQRRSPQPVLRSGETWEQSLDPAAQLNIPDRHMQYLYETALRTLVLFSAGRIVPGPYTYRRFWYRDAVLMLHAMLSLNLVERCRRQLDLFFDQQQHNGYFASQEGEWDSNGQVLWLFDRFEKAAPDRFEQQWLDALVRGARWIEKKRQVKITDSLHTGLLPAGFSAEHLGPNDYYYWDDFWSIAGLYGASRLAGRYTDAALGAKILQTARSLEKATFRSISAIPVRRSRGAVPASPYRRMDAGAVGSLAADYPLHLTPPGDPRMISTADFLMEHCFFEGGFFQDMIHSGINAYLTLDIAQTLLRNADPRFRRLMETVAGLASGTGQWPEAVHPATGGGCMGDGHHGWASAEWLMMIRNCFVREEGQTLVIGSGLFEEWLQGGQSLSFGPTRTSFGTVSVSVAAERAEAGVRIQSRWHGTPPRLRIRLPGFDAADVEVDEAASSRINHVVRRSQ